MAGTRRSDVLWLRDRLLPCLILGALAVTISLCLRSSYFLVRTVQVTGVTGQVAAAVAIKAGIADQNVFALNPARIQHNVVTVPEIESATIQLQLPNSLAIHVQPYVPVAVWQVADKSYLVTGNGFVIVPGSDAKLTLIIDQTAKTLQHGDLVSVQALQAVVALRPVLADLGLQPLSYTIDAPRSLAVRLAGGATVEFDTAGDLQRQANTLAAFLRLKTPFQLVDLRPGDTPYWR